MPKTDAELTLDVWQPILNILPSFPPARDLMLTILPKLFAKNSTRPISSSIAVATLATALMLVLPGLTTVARGAEKPNVLFILADDK